MSSKKISIFISAVSADLRASRARIRHPLHAEI